MLELCDGVDLLIHDAQHTTEEYVIKRTWGHCTVEYAIHVAKEAGARELALFHHCPSHGDDELDDILRDARDLGADQRPRGVRGGRRPCATSCDRATTPLTTPGAQVPEELSRSRR